jgi:hypothetical protein
MPRIPGSEPSGISAYPTQEAAALGIDLTAQPGYDEILAGRADRMAVMRRIVTSLSLVVGGPANRKL